MLKNNLFVKAAGITSSIALALALVSCGGTSISDDDAKKFNKIYQEQALAWNFTYFAAEALGFSSVNEAEPVQQAQTIIERTLPAFYYGINNFGKVDVDDGKFKARNFNHWEFFAQTCEIALDNPSQMEKLASTAQDIEQFCKKTVFYYQLFDKAFTRDQIYTVNAQALSKHLSEREYEKAQQNKLNFTWTPLTAADLNGKAIEAYVKQ
ncbi:hypothetical protein [Psittacicella hinzii]|uniref:Lipoprotein n=1 Tax=Psittacicella hinzii TaxID=2028575 RepID=A0A3A1YJU0_9GAMM|nr:hypothetical protein [Psittacicella hinzii]RIY37509.1 hypothetical protein CKF58_04890 [Psittacicella hinzii]